MNEELQLFGRMYDGRMIRTWIRDRPEGWLLTSGAWSPFYFMFREVPSVPDLFRYSVSALTQIVQRIAESSTVDLLVGVASTGIPLAAGVALETNLPLAYTRKVAGLRTIADIDSDAKQWGDHALVEGQFQDGMNYVLVDDVVTGGASKELARQQVELEARRRGIRLHYIATAVVVDRGYPGHQSAELRLHAKHRFYEEVDQLLTYGASEIEVEVVKRYLETPEDFQDPQKRETLLGGGARSFVS